MKYDSKKTRKNVHLELSFQALSNQKELVILKEVWSQLFHYDLRFFSVKHLLEGGEKQGVWGNVSFC